MLSLAAKVEAEDLAGAEANSVAKAMAAEGVSMLAKAKPRR